MPLLSASAGDQGGRPIARLKESLICCPGDSVTLDGWASLDPGGEVYYWIWRIGGASDDERTTEFGELTIRAPNTPQTYTVILRVQDREGNASAPDSAMLHVMDSPPRARVGADTTIKIGVRIQFEPRVVTHCSRASVFEWDLDDDGQYEYRSNRNGRTTKTYYKPGIYRARFRVTDNRGRQAGGIRTITVTAGM